ncbi:hypothetical protein Rfer_1585 [Rhodoferax ferrireducens T118]|uniref:DUF5666 domain-containing protein n=1 Tax=Albidiferax ferrireducens (strain ATCC BAA-621 / DSM 15236 / T118) TaxID=338969 RepID=Q21Y36_ALBFT|nr:DUF5666 domain-containing protein [Rhodoferax ferrireducens]ABD69317.1 hypothetical protein Rfer_1585 [Rhodoferax ferrireducens T118]
MSEHQPQDSSLTRRHWLVLAASAVSGCGGGSTSTTASLSPGTGGTGVVYTQGSISGFGSVIVNGIKFDDLQATVQMDGGPAESSNLRVGMVVAVQGTRLADPTLGTASHIEVWSIAQGPVLQGPTVTQNSQRADGSVAEFAEFSVAGMTVQTNPDTSFYGVALASDLLPNQAVTVWGLQAGADGTRWTATYVEVRPMGMDMVSTGVVHVAGLQRSLNGLLLAGSMADTLVDGSLVRVQGVWSDASNSLAVAHAKLLGSGLLGQLPDEAKIEVEIEGFVTDTPTASGFMLGNIVVDASAIAPISTQIKEGARVEVYGTWQSGVLKATEVELENEQTLQTVELKGVIEVFTSKAEFWVRGQRCDASGIAKVEHGTLADLKQGVEVKLKGSKAGDVVMVTELEIVVND